MTNITFGPTIYNPTVAKYGFAKTEYNTKTGEVLSTRPKVDTFGRSNLSGSSNASRADQIAQAAARSAQYQKVVVYDKSSGTFRQVLPSDFLVDIKSGQIVGKTMSNNGKTSNVLQKVYDTSTGKQVQSSETYTRQTGQPMSWGVVDFESPIYGQRLKSQPQQIVRNIQPIDVQPVQPSQPYVAPFFGVQPIGTSKGGMKFFGSASYKQ